MAATYDSTLSTDKDWVRFLVGDTDITNAQLSDEEIAALLIEEANKYLAAAAALSRLLVTWSSSGKGLIEKRVGDLTIKRGLEDSAEQSVRNLIRELRIKGAGMTISRPKVFKVL